MTRKRRKKHRHALVDADIFLYKTAFACEKNIDWGDGEPMITIDLNEARGMLDIAFAQVEKTLKVEEMTVALTCERGNWRKGVLPSYKANRKDKRKPEGFKELRKFIKETYHTYEKPTLEADDVLGILQTRDEDDTIIVTTDKDLKTIPGWHYNPDKRRQFEITQYEADYWHFYQTLVGDSVDGFSGCPGIGPKKAERLLMLATWDMAVGKPWDVIVEEFVEKGMTEEEALVQARVARICRVGDYNFKEKEVILWSPAREQS